MIGLFASIFPIGGILGPNLGGFIIEHFGWREIFLINVPIGIARRRAAGAAGAATNRAGGPARSARRTIDVLGTALFATLDRRAS